MEQSRPGLWHALLPKHANCHLVDMLIVAHASSVIIGFDRRLLPLIAVFMRVLLSQFFLAGGHRTPGICPPLGFVSGVIAAPCYLFRGRKSRLLTISTMHIQKLIERISQY